jgi:Family of unknown function (DUF6152)
MRAKLLLLTCAAATAVALPAAAHHSFSMFDRQKTVQLTGIVKQLEWMNPHTWLDLMVADKDGKAVLYPLEMQGTGQAEKNGWRPDTVKPGDRVSVMIHPLKSGSHGGQLLAVTLPDGRRLAVGGAPASPITGE